jgi:hypothetical protein
MNSIKRFFDTEEDYQAFLTAEKELTDRMELNILDFSMVTLTDEEEACEESES